MPGTLGYALDRLEEEDEYAGEEIEPGLVVGRAANPPHKT